MLLLRCAYYLRACTAVQAECLSHVLRLVAMELASLGSISHITVKAGSERLYVPVPDGRVNARPTERMMRLRRRKFDVLREKLGGTAGACVHVLEMGRDVRRGRVRGEGLALAHLCCVCVCVWGGGTPCTHATPCMPPRRLQGVAPRS